MLQRRSAKPREGGTLFIVSEYLCLPSFAEIFPSVTTAFLEFGVLNLMVCSVVLPEFLLCLELRPTATALVTVPGQERGVGAHYSHPRGVRVGERVGDGSVSSNK